MRQMLYSNHAVDTRKTAQSSGRSTTQPAPAPKPQTSGQTGSKSAAQTSGSKK
jgi:hypothetical protein